MSSDAPTGGKRRLLKGATTALMTGLAVVVLWLYAYNLIVHKMNPTLAFFKVLDGVNDLVLGMAVVVAIGVGIVLVFTLTTLFTQSITNLYSARITEDLVRDLLLTGDFKVFFGKFIRFNEIPNPETPFPRHVSSTLFVLCYHYLIAWFYLVVFTECLYFAAWSAGVYLDLHTETIGVIPMFAIAVPFTARLMAYLDYPYAEDYASFIPGILFVVVLLLAFVAGMGGPFQFFMEDAYNRELEGFYSQGSLFWKFLRDGCLIAFYPVFGEVVFFYLQYLDLKKEVDEEEAAGVPAESAEPRQDP